jgi:SPP1 family predicted phage head-tail adaptor
MPDRVTRGRRRHYVHVYNPGPEVADGEGGFTQTPIAASPAGVWAEIRPASAGDLERLVANSVQAVGTHIVTLDWHPQITTATELRFGSRSYQVTGVQDPDERHRDLVLACKEAV